MWLVTIRGIQQPPPDSRTDHAKTALIRQLHLAGRWRAGAVVLRLYARASRAVADHAKLAARPRQISYYSSRANR